MTIDPTFLAIGTLVAQAGINPADLPRLLQTASDRTDSVGPSSVTVAEFAAKFLAVLNRSTQRTYRTPMRFLCDGWSVPESQIELVREVAAEFAAELPPDRELKQVGRLPRVTEGVARSAEPHLLIYAAVGTWRWRTWA